MSKSYAPISDTSPIAYSSSMQSAEESGQSCSTVSSSYTSSTLYNNGTNNTDPIYTHNRSFVKGHVSYQLLNNNPIVVESRI